MDVITRILGTLTEIQANHTDSVVLTSEERLSPHGIVHTTAGRKLRISLPRPTELFDGDVLAIDQDVAIVVEAAAEEVLILSPRTPLEWGMIAFNLGNLHRPVRFADTAILTPADPLVADLLNQLGFVFEREMIPFVGQRANLQTSHHAHRH